MKLLIGENVKTVRMVLKRTLFQLGLDWTVLEGWDGSSVMDAFLEHEPDYVVLDADLPEVDGWELLRCMRDINRKTKVILMSGSQEPEDVLRALELGASAFFGKPFDKAELAEALGIELLALKLSA